ncbi:MAG: glutaredoxin family protein [Pseudomonadota bacterium]
MKQLTLYSRPGCHLCENLLEGLLPMIRGQASLEERNIDLDAQLRQQFDIRVPVLCAGDRVLCEAFLDAPKISAWLAEPE